MRRQFVALDFIRFTTAFCVLLFHYEIFARRGVPDEERIFRGFEAGVDFFFILSGFVIAHSSADAVGTIGNYARFLQRRLARIYPLHALTLIAALALAVAAAQFGFGINDPGRYDLRYLPGNL